MWVKYIISPTLQGKKLRHMEASYQMSYASKLKSWDLNRSIMTLNHDTNLLLCVQYLSFIHIF